MTSFLRFVLKLFAWIAGIAIAMILLYSLLGLPGQIGVCFGLVIAGAFLIVGVGHVLRIHSLSFPLPPDPYEVKHVREADLNVPYDTAFDLCRDSLFSLRRSSINKESKSLGRIDAKTGLSWWSWGNRISIHLDKLSDSSTHIQVVCEPIVRTTMVDFGSNLENAEQIILFLTPYRQVNTSPQMVSSGS